MMGKKLDGFTLYTTQPMNDDGGSSNLSGFSGLSPYSGPSQGSSNTRLHGGRAPPPHTMLRTNFTTANNNGQTRRSLNSPNMSHFHTMNTPPAPMGGAANNNGRRNRLNGMMASKFSTWFILICIVLGMVLGAVTHHYHVDPAVSKWIKLPGDLYIRAIQCVVIPLIFVNLAVSVADIIHAGEGKRLGVRVALFVVFTSLISIGIGIGMGYISRMVLNITGTSKQSAVPAVFGIQCSNGKYLEELSSGMLTCTADAVNTTSQFIVKDVNNAFVRNTGTSSSVKGTLTDNLITVLRMVVPANIMAAFVNNTLLSLVAFAIPCGVTLAKSFNGPIQFNPLLEFLREINETLVMMIHWVIRFTPIAVLSLLGGSFGASLDSIMATSPIKLTLHVTGLFLAAITVHMLVVIPAIFTVLGRSNPLKFMMHLTPAYAYSLGCSSSMATLPIAMRCIESSRAVSNSVMYFVMSIGASLNMNGTAIYLPMMVMFLVDVSGLGSKLDTLHMGILVLASFLGSLAAAPVPSGSLLILTTVWGITFPTIPLPPYYAFLVAADVVLDRLITLCNIHCDAMICRIIEDQVHDEDIRRFANPGTLRA